VHFQDRIPAVADADALVEELKLHHEGQGNGGQVLADLEVAFAQAGDFAGEAFDRPLAAAGAFELVNVGKVAGARHGQAHGIEHRLSALQFRISQGAGRSLNGFVVVLGIGPRHGHVPREG
jgi:hypothetical protein